MLIFVMSYAFQIIKVKINYMKSNLIMNENEVHLPYKFTPRVYQTPLLKAFFIDKYRHIYILAHRRSGKDKLCINILLAAACQRVGTYLYLFPQTNQARRVIWRGIDGSGFRFLDHIPASLIAKTNGTDMSIELINGSVIQLGGSNNYDALMGSNPVGIIYSELPLHNPLARQYLNPILVENGGWEILNGTPRGKNHGYHIWKNAINNEEWYTARLTIEDTFKDDGTPVITQAQIEQERRNGVSDELLRQEYYCDFQVGTQGAYYTKEMDQMEDSGRICEFEISKSALVYTSWDLGVSDPTSIIWFQMNGHYIDLIYYMEKTDEGVEYFARQLNEVQAQLGFRKYQNHFAPHDIANREWGSSARSRLSLAHDAGIHFLIVRNSSIDDGIQATRSILPRIRIHAKHSGHLVDVLKEYKREYDEVNKTFKQRPLHSWASHGADCLRYLAVAWRDQFNQPHMNEPKKFISTF